MRIAFIADIHGNLAAFEAVLEDIHKQAVDLTVIVGDIVVGVPDSAPCWHLAQRLDIPIIGGNHESYIAQFNSATANPLWRSEFYSPLQWAVAEFTEEERCAMNDLPQYLRLPTAPNILIVHGSLRSNKDTVAPHTPEEELAKMFPDIQERYIVRAHNHYSQVRLWQDRIIITTGSVGLAQNDFPGAQYVILEQKGQDWKIQHRVVSYNIDATLKRFRESGYLEATGPMGYLFLREVATASRQCVPFGIFERQISKQVDILFAQAFEYFLEADPYGAIFNLE